MAPTQYESGYDDGYMDGVNTAYNDGRKNGYHQGFLDGIREGWEAYQRYLANTTSPEGTPMKTKMFFGVRNEYAGTINGPDARGVTTYDMGIVIEGNYIVEMDQYGKPTFVPIEYLQQPHLAIDHRNLGNKPIPLTIQSLDSLKKR